MASGHKNGLAAMQSCQAVSRSI